MNWTMRKMFERSVLRDTGEGGGGEGVVVSDEQSALMDDILSDYTFKDEPVVDDLPEDKEKKVETKEEPVTEEEKAKQDIGDPEPKEKEETTDTTTDDSTTKDNESNPYEATIEALRKQVMDLTNLIGKDPTQQKVQADVSTEQKAEGKEEPAKANEPLEKALMFLTDEELDRVIDEPALLNKGLERAFAVMRQQTMVDVGKEIQRQMMVQRAVSNFYSQNEDLKAYAPFVKFVMNELEQANPDKTYGDLFNDTAIECRKRLGLPDPSVQQKTRETSKGEQKPAFAGSKRGTARPVDSGFKDKDMEDIFNLPDF